MVDLRETLQLERLEVNLFRGFSQTPEAGRIYGGQVIAQSLQAAYATVEGRVCHSLHCYFIRPGDPKIPIIFEVDRARDGHSFTTRRVIAVQHGRQIFNLAASFQIVEDGFEHQFEMPRTVGPEGLPDLAEALGRVGPHASKDEQQPSYLKPIDIRFIDTLEPHPDGSPLEPVQRAWFRVAHPLPDDVFWHQAAMAYASDMGLLATSLRPHGSVWNSPDMQGASLDHAMWFHHPTDFTQWHLYVMDSPSASGARGLNRGTIYRHDGTLVASSAQEGLIRYRGPRP
ncbi:MAG TPA: acyl-CoA thioesterase II [Phenylobacterium sp.]|uniref:acyl-CoA thioesterase n=1 Tax=Phenylobacterium sp. TaxID=1871053 RepID=UPI002B466D68|nr:acyl-CoA thioesterase II [Phenylobacterium sp.]HKR87878.1 acyl-CoA thioesterase II [Phenylobacterium sp.]